jgi:hypothetical protein
MDFTVRAQGQGKIIRIYDRMAGADAFSKFLDADQIPPGPRAPPTGRRATSTSMSR